MGNETGKRQCQIESKTINGVECVYYLMNLPSQMDMIHSPVVVVLNGDQWCQEEEEGVVEASTESRRINVSVATHHGTSNFSLHV
jgi:hypothetical protein